MFINRSIEKHETIAITLEWGNPVSISSKIINHGIMPNVVFDIFDD